MGTMASGAINLLIGKARRELVLLLVASLAVVVALVVALTRTTGSGIGAGRLLALAIVLGGASLAGYSLTMLLRASRKTAASATTENRELRRRLTTTEALIKAEPQVLIHWEEGQSASVVTHTLAGIPGLPGTTSELLRFGVWLEERSSTSLKSALDELVTEGRGFSLVLRTLSNGYVEAEGRAASGRGILRLRDVTGLRRDITMIVGHQETLTRAVSSARALLDALPMPVWFKTPDGQLNWVNAAYLRAVDAASVEEVRDRQIELLETRQRKNVSDTLAGGEIYHRRLPLIVGGQRKSHDVIVLPLDNAIAGAAIDVAALETAQGELERQIASYDRTLDRVATAVAIFNSEQQLSFFNEAYTKLWGLDATWLKTRPPDSAILDRLRELGRLPEVVNYKEWKAKLLATYHSGTGHEDLWHLRDGRMLHVMSEQRPDGGVTYLYADETEKFALESRFKTLISVQGETLNSLKEGVAVFATNGRLQLFNVSFCSIWKLPRRALEANPHIDEIVHDAAPGGEEAIVWASLARLVTAFMSEREAMEGRMNRADGSVVDYAATPLPDGATLLTFADVTDARRAERALVERNEALVAADRLKTHFISHVSYELRTPLTNIIGFSELLANPRVGALSDKQREYLEDITSSSKTLLAIIDDILDLATIDAGALDLRNGPIDVRALIRTAIMGVRDPAIRNNLMLDIAVADDVHSFMGDEPRVRQVLYNLLSNAVGFSKPGDVIHLSCWREHGMVVFTVEDQGPGIPAGQQRRVFDRFESRTQGFAHRGAGLGLSIAKSLVELHGGDIMLQSEPGTGTRVTVRFPERGRSIGRLEGRSVANHRHDRTRTHAG
jgi:signal transduction histidine kinase